MSGTSAAATMRAIVFAEGRLAMQPRQPAPSPADGWAIVRPRKVGVCATDVELCRGLMNFTGIPGREFVGVVESMNEGGGGTDGSELVGKRVVGSPNTFCGSCGLCRRGLRQHCRQRLTLGMRGLDGCFADRFTLPAANLVPLPDDVDDDHGVFACAVSSAIHANQQLTITGKPYITVLGDGPLGLLTVQVLAKLNASVRLIGRYSEKLALCEKWGIKHRHVDDIGRRADQDVVVDCTGSTEGLQLAMQLVRPRGKILLKSLTATQQNARWPIDLTPLVRNEIELIGSQFGPIDEAVNMLRRMEIDVVSLIGRRMKLDDGPAVFHAAAQPGALKVIVEV